MYFQCFVMYVLRGWYAFDWKAFLFYPIKFPDFSLTFNWFPKSFPWLFPSFHQDILVKKPYLFFLNVALVTLVYANIAISWQLLRFNSLKKHFLQIYRFKRFENGLEKKFPDLKLFSLILAENWFSLFFPDWKKSSNFSLISLIGGNPGSKFPDWKMLSHFPSFPVRVETSIKWLYLFAETLNRTSLLLFTRMTKTLVVSLSLSVIHVCEQVLPFIAIPSRVMVCLHCPTPIPSPIPIPIPIQMANIIMCRTVSTEPNPISIPMQMGTAPNLTPILVPIRWFFK